MEKLSNHPRSARILGDLKFHKDIYMPGNLISMCVDAYKKYAGQFRMTNKGKSKIGDDDSHNYDINVVERLANSIPDIENRILEVVANFHQDQNNPYSIKKFVARVHYKDKDDISIVFFVKDNPCILTAWINPKSDDHNTLKTTEYVLSKKDRQEKTAKMLQRVNENKIKIDETKLRKIIHETILRTIKKIK